VTLKLDIQILIHLLSFAGSHSSLQNKTIHNVTNALLIISSCNVITHCIDSNNLRDKQTEIMAI